jgi:6-phosphofructokinase 1
MSERIGIVTGGGDCPGLNAVIRAVTKAVAKRGWETIGFLGGYEGILEPQRYVTLDYQKLGSLLTRGGTILGTANRGRFFAKVGHGETRSLPQELIDGEKASMQKLNIRGLVSIGGDGSLSIGQQLFEGGVPLVGVWSGLCRDYRSGREVKDGATHGRLCTHGTGIGDLFG